MKKFLFSSLSVFLALASAVPVLANPVKQTRTGYSNGSPVTLNTVAITGFTPFEYQNVGVGSISRSVKPGCLGYVRVDIYDMPSTPTSITVDGTAYTVANFPSQPYRCGSLAGFQKLLDSTSKEAPTQPNFFLSDLDGRYYVKTSKDSTQTAAVVFNVPNEKAVRADACGMLTVRDSATNPWTSGTEIKVGSTTYTVGAITSGLVPRCVRVGEQYKLYSN